MHGKVIEKCSNPRCGVSIAYVNERAGGKPVCSMYCRMEYNVLVKWRVLEVHQCKPYNGRKRREHHGELLRVQEGDQRADG